MLEFTTEINTTLLMTQGYAKNGLLGQGKDVTESTIFAQLDINQSKIQFT